MITPVYQHTPLASPRSIRVFTILPSRIHNAPVEGFLTEVSLDANPVFEALSYACGKNEPGYDVTILPSPGISVDALSGRLAVTPNCLAALQTMRQEAKPRTTWIDSICIHQSLTSEKNEQVRMMTEIYKRAERVLIWLNPGAQRPEQVEKTAKVIKKLGFLHRAGLLRLYEDDEITVSRMPKDGGIVSELEKLIRTECEELGSKSFPRRIQLAHKPSAYQSEQMPSISRS